MCEQGLSTRHGRNMVVMQKVRDPTPETRAEFAEYKRAIATGTVRYIMLFVMFSVDLD